MSSKQTEIVQKIPSPINDVQKGDRFIAGVSLLASFGGVSVAAISFMQSFGIGISLASILGFTTSSLLTGGIAACSTIVNKKEIIYRRNSLEISHQIVNKVSDLVDGKFVVSMDTNDFMSIIQGRLHLYNVSLDSFSIGTINQFLYLLNANYYPTILEHFKTKYREDVIIETVDQLFSYLVKNNKTKFDEKELRHFFKEYQLLSKEEKKEFLKEFRKGRFKNSYYKKYEYAVFPKEFDNDVRPVNPMFHIKEEDDSYQLDLDIVLDIKQRISRLSADNQKKYNEYLHNIIYNSESSTFGPNIELRGQLCKLFAEVEFEQKNIINPRVYREFFNHFSFSIDDNDLDALEKGLGQFYSLIQFLEVNKTSIDFTEFLELKEQATEIICKLLIHYDEYAIDILSGMSDSYKSSVSIYIRERLESLLGKEELSSYYLSIYVLNQSDIPIEQYIARGINILRMPEVSKEIESTKKYIVKK